MKIGHCGSVSAECPTPLSSFSLISHRWMLPTVFLWSCQWLALCLQILPWSISGWAPENRNIADDLENTCVMVTSMLIHDSSQIEKWLRGGAWRRMISGTKPGWRPARSRVQQGHYWVQSHWTSSLKIQLMEQCSISKRVGATLLNWEDCWYAWELCCCPRGPGEAGEMGWQELEDVQWEQVLSPACGEE